MLVYSTAEKRGIVSSNLFLDVNNLESDQDGTGFVFNLRKKPVQKPCRNSKTILLAGVAMMLIATMFLYFGGCHTFCSILHADESLETTITTSAEFTGETQDMSTENGSIPNNTTESTSTESELSETTDIERTTRKLDPVIDNPVSFINERHMGLTEYTTADCTAEGITHITLTIYGFEGKVWHGKDKGKKAKQHAAYEAMKELYPDDLDEVLYQEPETEWECD